MFRSQSYDHHQGVNHRTCAIATYRRAPSSYSGLWLYVVCASVRMIYPFRVVSKCEW
jgi:hypothetical protein